jgi:hypothetical protein
MVEEVLCHEVACYTVASSTSLPHGCRKETKIARQFQDNWGYLVQAQPGAEVSCQARPGCAPYTHRI